MTKILIVDDEVNVRKLYSEELRGEGYHTISASTVKEALDSVEKDEPDLVILMKIAKQRKHLPVILNSAYSIYRDNFQTWAADAYIVKSVDLAPLKEKIRDLLTTRSVTA
jgi:DNA-binding response OmpR family regulator